MMMLLLKSRNTLVISAVLFLIVVLLLRLSAGFLGDNVVRIVGAIFAGKAENIPLLDFGTIDMSWLNPTSWSMDDVTSNVNQWLHEMIDSVLPAVIGSLNMTMTQAIITMQSEVWGGTTVSSSQLIKAKLFV